MIIERLSFESHNALDYDPEEASIHVARYQIAKKYIKNKNVLDIACGEGYGSFLLKKWGAKSVFGVDISQDSINLANRNFAIDGVQFACQNAEQDIAGKKFDVIISLETIEHVIDEALFLKSLKRMIADDGIIIISCPNDHWYYNDKESNPFHLRKYTFEEFQHRTSNILGNNSVWGIGTNVFGFGNFILNSKDGLINEELIANSVSDIVNQIECGSLMSKLSCENLPNIKDCLYYFGIWNFHKQESADLVFEYNVFPSFPIKPRFKTVNEYYIAYKKAEKIVQIRDEYIKKVEQMVLDRDSYIQNLEKLITEKNAYIAELEQEK